MAVSRFKRGLSPHAKGRLEDLAVSPNENWWKDLLALWGPSGTGRVERPLRLAVRDNYLNFYLRGQSVARVGFNGQGRPFLDVHVKYAFENATEQAYARLIDSEVVHPKSGQTVQYSGASTLWEWMARAARWETAEKAEVERIVADNGGIIDLEMGLPAHGQQKTALRMDLIALEPGVNGPCVVFWEAKRVTDARLRARGSKDPEVMTQVAAYRNYLADEAHRRAVIQAYAQTCALLGEFAGWTTAGGRPLALSPLVQKAAKNPEKLALDITPRLVILGTEDQMAAPGWQFHRDKLAVLPVPVLSIRTDGYRLDPPEMNGGTSA